MKNTDDLILPEQKYITMRIGDKIYVIDSQDIDGIVSGDSILDRKSIDVHIVEPITHSVVRKQKQHLFRKDTIWYEAFNHQVPHACYAKTYYYVSKKFALLPTHSISSPLIEFVSNDIYESKCKAVKHLKKHINKKIKQLEHGLR